MVPNVPRPQRGPSVIAGLFRKDEFKYDAGTDSFLCPAGQHLQPYTSCLQTWAEDDHLCQSGCVPGLSSSLPMHWEPIPLVVQAPALVTCQCHQHTCGISPLCFGPRHRRPYRRSHPETRENYGAAGTRFAKLRRQHPGIYTIDADGEHVCAGPRPHPHSATSISN
jgi:hypothetical protein